MICIFDKFTPQNKFDTCGERILNPTSAYEIEERNGNYSYEISVPMLESDDSWKFVKPYNIIKSSRGQLFPINKVEYGYVSGVPTVKAWARHIWYYLSDKIVFESEINNYSCYWAIANILENTYYGRGDKLVDYEFRHNSDITDLKKISYDRISAANAILGSGDSIINLYGGELYRDNFYFSVNRRKEGAENNAFSLIYDWNCTEIKHTIDLSESLTEIDMTDNLGNWMRISRVPDYQFPHQVMIAKRMSYDKETGSQIDIDTGKYWNDNCYAKVTYDVNLIDLKDTNREAGWGNLEKLTVGNTGYVHDIIGEMHNDVQIISTKYNDITGRMENVKLGNFRPSPLHYDRWDKVLSGDNAAYRRLDVLEGKSNFFTLVED